MDDNLPPNMNQELKYRRLAFYAEDITGFNDALLAFLKKSGARSALLIDKEGHLVAKQGFLGKLDTNSMAALVAGSFASTREVARLLGDPEFTVMNHQGSSHSISITLVGERTLQVAVFDSKVMPGMISVMAKELAVKILAVLKAIQARPPREDEGKKLGAMSSEMKGTLDKLFGGDDE